MNGFDNPEGYHVYSDDPLTYAYTVSYTKFWSLMLRITNGLQQWVKQNADRTKHVEIWADDPRHSNQKI